MAGITLDGVTKRFSSEMTAVDDVSLEIGDGEFMVLVGPSGCGKSTLLRMIAGLEEVTDGRIDIGGSEMNDLPPKDRDIAMVFQNYALYPHMTVEQNLGFGLKLRRRRSRTSAVASPTWRASSASRTCSIASPSRSPEDSGSASRWVARWCASRRHS